MTNIVYITTRWEGCQYPLLLPGLTHGIYAGDIGQVRALVDDFFTDKTGELFIRHAQEIMEDVIVVLTQ